MSQLPSLTGQEMIRVLKKQGFNVARIKGSLVRDRISILPPQSDLDSGTIAIVRNGGQSIFAIICSHFIRN